MNKQKSATQKEQKNALQKKQNELAKSDDFQPTPHMLVWLDTQIRIASDVIDEIARQSKISDASWYNWLQKPGFEDWYWSEYDKRIRRWKPLVDALGVKFASRGSDKHFEYLARRVGNLPDRPEQQTNIQVNLGEEASKYGIE